MSRLRTSLLLAALVAAPPCTLNAQAKAGPLPQSDNPAEQVRQLAARVQVAEQRLHDSEGELAALKGQLAMLEAALQPGAPVSERSAAVGRPSAPSDSADAIAMQANQIATLDQIKVETSSKFPLKVNGIVLLSASVNSSGVDSPVDPTAALGGPGSTALSLRQTILGLEAIGPHLAGASSSADVRIDFAGSSGTGAYPTAGNLLRLRTAHASLDWESAQLFFSFDRTLLNPNTPASLVQVAEPAFSWSGNLWNWMPQIGVSSHFGVGHVFVLEGAWASPPDAPYPAPPYTSSRREPPSLSEASGIPGGEARVGYERGGRVRGLRLGVGGYISPHRLPHVGSFNSWAATLDLRMPISRRVDLAGSFYRGAGLGGLGAGGYKDWVSESYGTEVYVHAPEDVGGWAQFAVHLSPTLDWNTGFGLDNVFAGQLRSYSYTAGGYGSIARNRTTVSNLIWSPRPYLPFSFEYRRLYTAPVTGPVWNANVFAFGGGYRF